jgi:hypothetical protein
MMAAPAETRTIAAEAYTYGFPLVDNYRIQHAYFIDKKNPEFKAPWNKIYSNARVCTPEDKAIQSPDSDTPYSYVGADLRWEPLILRVPRIEGNRYYALQFIDAYTFNFAYIGSRTTGNDGACVMLVGPDWRGDTPTGVTHVIRSETQFAFVLYRTQLFDPDDMVNVRKVQAGYRVQRLSDFLIKMAPRRPAEVEFPAPLRAGAQRTSPEFFNLLNFVLRFCPTHPSEEEVRARFASIGVGAGERIDFKHLSRATIHALEEGIADAWDAFDELKTTKIETGRLLAGDTVGTREYLRNNYAYRMAAAVLGIYGNSREETLYPAYFRDADGNDLDGRQRYTLHFDAGRLPPVNAFWSLTLYELPASLLYANALNRYVINSSMLPQLERDAAGGITLYVQHESPGENKEPNWLPSPAGKFLLTMRLYWPKAEALDGRWKEPPLQRAG